MHQLLIAVALKEKYTTNSNHENNKEEKYPNEIGLYSES
jgi:hypothetical protein